MFIFFNPWQNPDIGIIAPTLHIRKDNLLKISEKKDLKNVNIKQLSQDFKLSI